MFNPERREPVITENPIKEPKKEKTVKVTDDFDINRVENPDNIVKRDLTEPLPRIEEMVRGKEFCDEVEKRVVAMKKAGIPVSSGRRFRLDINKFFPDDKLSDEQADEIVNKIEKDDAECKKLEEKWRKEGTFGRGESVEMLITYLLQEFLEKYGIKVVRATEHDDYKNEIDTVLVGEKTGKIIGALDEISATYGENLDYKSKLVELRNKCGGGRLDYGIEFKQQEGETKLKKGPIGEVRGKKFVEIFREIKGERIVEKKGIDVVQGGIPIFVLPLSRDNIKAGISNFDNKIVCRSLFFDHLVPAFKSQIESFEDMKDKDFFQEVSPEWIKQFKDSIATFKGIIGNAKRD